MGVDEQVADFGVFYERTYPAAFRVAYGILGRQDQADDVTQDAYTTAYRERGRYRGEGPPEAWLYRIVVNKALATLRHQRVRRFVPLDPAVHARPAEDGSSMVDRVAIAEGLQQLDPRSRAAIVLRYYLDLDYASIGTILAISPTNVGAILSRSRDRLRELLAPAAAASGADPAPMTIAKEAARHG
jgi:RNA polymerase sigma-70 factor (ECF subfamily)